MASEGAGGGARGPETATRLAAWMVAMGAAPRTLPPPHYLHQLCRGKYGDVWESVMRQAVPRAAARHRRLQVLVRDVEHYRSVENSVQERMGAVVVPEELEVWRETQALRRELARAEARVAADKRAVGALADSVATKLGQRAALAAGVADARRRLCLLAAAAERLQGERAQLAEMADCTRQLLPAEASDGAEEAIEECLAVLLELAGRRTADARLNSTQLASLPGRDWSVPADKEQVVAAHARLLALLARAPAADLWAALRERQAELVHRMAEDASRPAPAEDQRNGARGCVAETSALHCTLTLRALENRQRSPAQQRHLLQLIGRAQVAGAGADAEARGELFILHCEKADLESRVHVLRSELEELMARRGAYAVGGVGGGGSLDSIERVLAEISDVDRECLAEKAGTEARMCSLERTTHKIASVSAQLRALLGAAEKPWGAGEPLSLTGGGGGKHDASVNSVNSNYDEFVSYFRNGRTGGAPEAAGEAERAAGGARLDLSVFTARAHAAEAERAAGARPDLSLDLDRSARSEPNLNGTAGTEPRFSDELSLFLREFRLERNRKIVLDSGESLWLCETLRRLAPAPARTLAHTGALAAARAHVLARAGAFAARSLRDGAVLGWTADRTPEVSGLLAAGGERGGRVKRRAAETRGRLRGAGARLARALEALALWRAARARPHTGGERRVDGRAWPDYEAACADRPAGAGAGAAGSF